MTATPFRLLLLEDNAGDARLVQTALAEHAPGEFAVTRVERLADALVRIASEHFDAVLCDLGLPDSTGLATAQAIAARAPALPLVVLTGSHNEDLGRAAIHHGAQDYVIKGEASGPMVARTLQEGGLATFRVDLLLPDEAQVLHNIFDIHLLADRLLAATEWVMQQQETKGLRIGYMSTSNGTAAALQAAARLPEAVGAVVSRGGRPDLARTFLPQVKAPTLLLVGENDHAATEQNQKAYQQLACPKELIIVPGASHLFEEPGTFDQVAVHARAWFLRYLVQESA